MLTFTVRGKAEPKGSTKVLPAGRVVGQLRRRPLIIRNMRELMTSVVVTSDNPHLKSWQSRIAFEATTAMRRAALQLTGPVALTIAFYLPRPKALPKSYRGPHIRKPDLDKLVRAAKDALKGVVYDDDSQVTRLIVGKDYARFGDEPRVDITVEPIQTDEPIPLLDDDDNLEDERITDGIPD